MSQAPSDASRPGRQAVERPDLVLVDSHCHFDDRRFDGDRNRAWVRARTGGVSVQVLPGVTAPDWPRIEALSRGFAGLYPSYGIHPRWMPEDVDRAVRELEQWLAERPAVALGECGLDGAVLEPSRALQRRGFLAQLELARARDLPVIIHAHGAMEEVVQTIRRLRDVRGVVHSFSGSRQQAEQLVEAGLCLGLGGPLTYPRAARLRRIAAALPLDALVLETDSPFQPVCGEQGRRNEPSRLPRVAQALAEVRQQPLSEIAAATSRTAGRLFGFGLP